MQIIKQITKLNNLHSAWRYIRTHSKDLGIDRDSLHEFELKLSRNLEILRLDIDESKFIPSPNRQMVIDKPGKPGEKRELRIPQLRDKIVQQAVRLVIEPILEKKFLDTSYAYRPGRGCHRAIRRVQHEIRHFNALFAVRSDIDNFFDSISHDVLLEQFRKLFPDTRLQELIMLFVKNGLIAIDGKYIGSETGVPTGSILAPLLSNLYLHDLDRFMTDKKAGYIRYADDFIVMCQNKQHLLNLRQDIHSFLTQTLRLKLNVERKEPYSIHDGFPFLGLSIRRNRITILPEKIQKIRESLRHLERISRYWNIRSVILKTTEKAAGWYHYYKITDNTDELRQIETAIWKLLRKSVHHRVKRGYIKHIDDIDPLLLGFPVAVTSLETLLAELKAEPPAQTSSSQPADRTSARAESAAPPAKPQPVVSEPESLASEIQPSANPEPEDTHPPAPQKEKKEDAVTQQVEGKLAKQRRIYQKAYIRSSELAIWTQGAHLGATANRISVRIQGQRNQDIPADRIKHVTIQSLSTMFTGHFVKLCSEHGIAATFLDRKGDPIACIHPVSRTDIDLLIRQLACSENRTGLDISREIIEGKIRNQLNLLKYYRKRIESEDAKKLDELSIRWNNLETVIDQLVTWEPPDQHAEGLQSLLNIESRAGYEYWAGVRILVRDDIEFTRRERAGAKDPFNMALNYGYGILYSRLFNYCHLAGLEPAIGIFHKHHRGKPALTFDLIEEFRAFIVDRTVIGMVTRGEKINVEGEWLTKEIRQRLAAKILQRIGTSTSYRGESCSLDQVMMKQVERLKNHLQDKESYRAFVARW